ncbi:hypothetical protein [Mucilaginibacter myungsuensis]|uniref:Uncharacterized protein n=1 Tax=Mucilaginibacter myungsuensis TaxID=649104 RepID=A0A929L133_9SPHI|nr:hypothetical protein [Mucilaginibacter myungsuensis]MBE9662175.1 hypothetical protein [Mucilaginibacter myungsuensis]MDN3599391.1 hypothetical protein [Mucilaginibacter myungsuensis]
MRTEEDIKTEIAILQSMSKNDKRAKLDISEYQHKIVALKWVLEELGDILDE